MMGIETIRSMAEDAGKRAKFQKREPKVLDAFSTDEDIRNIPLLGDYEPPGWELTDRLFVDISGYGAPNEPALTFGQFAEKIRQKDEFAGEVGYGIVETGQFQAWIGRFERTT